MSAAKHLEAYFAARDKPEWSEAEGQLMAYSTQDVLNALNDARRAERTAAGLFDDHLVGPMHKASDLEEAGDHSASQQVIDEQLAPAVQRTDDGLSDRDKLDKALMDQIRKELQEQPRDDASRPALSRATRPTRWLGVWASYLRPVRDDDAPVHRARP